MEEEGREVDQREQAVEGRGKYPRSLSVLGRPTVVLCGWGDDSDTGIIRGRGSKMMGKMLKGKEVPFYTSQKAPHLNSFVV